LSSKESDKNDEFVREADDSSGNGSDESDDSDEFECQVQGNNRLDQYCENKDELQHDQQEEGLNHGHTNTQRKNHTPKPGPRNEPISWDDRIRDLYDFKETFGHCRVQQRFKDNPGLGRFVATMRSSKKRIKQGTYSGSVLTPARINELDELGFEWGQKNKVEHRIEQLKALKELHGHLRVTKTLDKELAAFCKYTRAARRKPASTRSICTEERIKALDDLGFEWNLRNHLLVSWFDQRIEQRPL